MEVLDLDGVKYVKANSIARDFGYTPDYVGQLCRAGKVQAKLVGRSWYVSETSVRKYKASNTRSSKTRSVKAIQRTLVSDGDDGDTTVVPIRQKHVTSNQIHASHHFYTLAKGVETKYEADDHELIPTLTDRDNSVTPTRTSVELVDSKRVSIKKANPDYVLRPVKHPRIRFTDKVSIFDPKEQLPSASADTKKIAAKQLEIFKKPTVSKDSTSNKSQTVLIVDQNAANPVRSVPLQRGQAVAVPKAKMHRPVTPVLDALPATNVEQSAPLLGRFTFSYITTSVVVALLLVGSLVLIEHSVSVTAGTQDLQSRYNLNLSAALNAIYHYK